MSDTPDQPLVNTSVVADTSTQEGTIDIVGKIILRTATDIAVEIISPYRSLSKGMHKPYYASRVDSLGFLGIEGEQMAEILLQQLYAIGHFLDVNMDDLKEILALGDCGNFPAMNKDNVREYFRHWGMGDCYQFFDELFPMGIPIDTRPQVLEILKGRKSLK